MLGRTHALTGLCSGLALASATGSDLATTIILAVTTAGFALLPDLDHPGARASRLFGPVSATASKVLRAGSSWLYHRTKGPRDARHDGEHRHATHTVAFALLLGGLVAWGSWGWGSWFTAAVAVVGVLLAVDALGRWVLAVAVVASVAVWAAGSDLTGVGGWLGVAVAVGCITHDLGDACTLSGCPFLAPIPIAGETWYEIKLPRLLRFRTGGAVELRIVFPAFVVVAILLSPGVWPTLMETTIRWAFSPPLSFGAATSSLLLAGTGSSTSFQPW